MSLIELMIAMVVGLIVIGAVLSVYVATSRNYTQDEMLSRMQENARYAMHVLAEDLSMGGYWGPLMTGKDINTDARDCSSTPSSVACKGLFEDSELYITTDCGPGTGATAPPVWAYSIDMPVEFETAVSASDAESDFDCIDSSDFLAGSDVLVVKRVEGAELASTRDDADDNGDVFVRTDGNDAMLFVYSTGLDASEGAGISDWRYRASVFYVRNYFLDPGDGIPTLVRKTLNGSVMETDPGGVAQGIEYFHVMFGVDQDGDAIANIYTSSPTAAQLDNITSARIYVLARSVAADANYENDKTYQLGDVSRTVDDSFYRRVFTTTVTLRNQRNRLLTTGG